MPPLFQNVAGVPAPVAPYSHFVECDGWVFVTGQLPIDPANEPAPLPPDVESQTHVTFANLRKVLASRGLDLRDVVAARCFLTHFEADYARFNRIYAGYFPDGRFPARTCIGVTALARGARVEIDFIARNHESHS
ncbi:MAG TPA: RidA family protein [Opitutaceae bacterium]|nr:RidA family protein [Opitutaceae bacterium]